MQGRKILRLFIIYFRAPKCLEPHAMSSSTPGFPGVGHPYEIVLSFASAAITLGATTRGRAKDFETGYDVARQLYRDLDSRKYFDGRALTHVYFDSTQLPTMPGTTLKPRGDGNGYFWANDNWKTYYKAAVRDANVFMSRGFAYTEPAQRCQMCHLHLYISCVSSSAVFPWKLLASR